MGTFLPWTDGYKFGAERWVPRSWYHDLWENLSMVTGEAPSRLTLTDILSGLYEPHKQAWLGKDYHCTMCSLWRIWSLGALREWSKLGSESLSSSGVLGKSELRARRTRELKLWKNNESKIHYVQSVGRIKISDNNKYPDPLQYGSGHVLPAAHRPAQPSPVQARNLGTWI